MEINIRMATANDIEKLIKARFDYFEIEGWELTSEQHAAINSNIDEYFKTHLDIDFFAAIIEESDQILSLAFLAISEKPANPFFPTGKIGTILNVLTYPAHRKKGYATKVISMLIEEAKRQNLSFIELSSSESGKSVYKRLGFKEQKHFLTENFTEMRMSLI